MIVVLICIIEITAVCIVAGNTSYEKDISQPEFNIDWASKKHIVDNNDLFKNSRNKTFYAQHLQDYEYSYFYFNPETPEIFNMIAHSDWIAMSGGCFVGDKWYTCEFAWHMGNSNISTINVTTGNRTLIGPAGVELEGLAYDYHREVLYGCSVNRLYRLNQHTGAASLIGPMGNAGEMKGIACDVYGNLYGEDLIDDCLYSINTNTGRAIVIGPFGIDLQFIQDMAFDKDNDICYITGYKGKANGGGALYSVDVNTGAATFIGDFPIGCCGCPGEVSALAIPYTRRNVTKIEMENLSNCAMGINAKIKNIGNYEAKNLKVDMKITGGYFDLINISKSTTVTCLELDEEVVARSGLFLGFGIVDIDIKAKAENTGTVRQKHQGIKIGPFVILLKVIIT